MNDLYSYNMCPKLGCNWRSSTVRWMAEDFQKTETEIIEHVNTHKIYRYVVRFRVWNFRRKNRNAARGEDAQ